MTSNIKMTKEAGRPRRGPEEVRRRTIGVRVNAAELKVLQEKADICGLPLAQWMRQVALSRVAPRPRVPEVNREAYADLARLAGNINQLVKITHRGQTNLPIELLYVLQEAINNVRLGLIGVVDDCQAG